MADDREAILARRRRLIAVALAGGAMATTAGCEPCLSPPHDGGPDAPATDAGMDASAMPCLSPPLDAPDVPEDRTPDAEEHTDAGDPDGG